MTASPGSPRFRFGRRGWLLVIAACAVVALVALWQWALREADAAIRAALGRDVRVASIDIAWNGVRIADLEVAAPPGWPAKHAARASSVLVVPEWLSLLSGGVNVSRVEVHGLDASVWRTAQGRWRVVPAFTERRREGASGTSGARAKGPPLSIGKVEIVGAQLTLVDSAVASGAHRIVLRGVDATLGGIRLGAEPQPISIEARARQGERGHARVQGRVTPTSLDSALEISLKDVALATVEPYLLKAAETGVKRGEFDLALRL
ncbi:MAG: DUF748 domain-containing protein, partial [Betaproteobacteria bacterium]|nr:DUF748 domain-containing protein [Betaproteobacteria bacterium]